MSLFVSMSMLLQPVLAQWGAGPQASYRATSDEAFKHQYVFARLAYPGCSGGYAAGKGWSTDFPKADRQLIMGLHRLMVLDAYEYERPVQFGTGEMGRFPFLYIVEAGFLCLGDEHVRELRDYIARGGFVFVDDFWGTMEWEHFLEEFRRVLPDAELRPITTDHPIFHQVFDIDELMQVPNVGQGMQGGPTFESDGYYAEAWGFFDDQDRLLVFIMHNTDLGDAWEWAENPYYPLKYSAYAYRV